MTRLALVAAVSLSLLLSTAAPPAGAATPAAEPRILINEIANGGVGNDSESFFELRNWGTASVDLTGWGVYRCSAEGLRANTGRTEGELVVFGAGTLVRALAEHDLVDEYRLLLIPVILGAGKRMFDDRGHPARFALGASTLAPSGVVILSYTRDTSG